MTQVPLQHRLGFRDRRQMIGVDQSLHRDRAQIGDHQVIARFQRLGGVLRNAEAEAAFAVEMSEKDGFGCRAEGSRFRKREQRIIQRRVFLCDNQFAADDVGAGARA